MTPMLRDQYTENEPVVEIVGERTGAGAETRQEADD